MGKQASTGKTPQAQGVGESKIHAAPEGTFKDAVDWSTLTVNGLPIPKALWGKMAYKMTDQGAEAANGGRPLKVSTVAEIVAKAKGATTDQVDRALAAVNAAKMEGKPIPKAAADILAAAARSAGAPLDNPEGKAAEAFRGGILSDHLALGIDPLTLTMDENVPEGSSGLWMSEAKVKREGMVRSGLRYQKVLGKDGQPITQGGMFLAAVPTEAKKASDAYYAGIGAAKMSEASDKVRESVDQIASLSQLDRMARRKGLDDNDIGLADESQESGDQALVEHLMHE